MISIIDRLLVYLSRRNIIKDKNKSDIYLILRIEFLIFYNLILICIIKVIIAFSIID